MQRRRVVNGYAIARRRMVDEQLIARGIDDPAVLRAMLEVPREAFVPARLAGRAYDDGPLLIGGGQTISQPFIVALMAQALALSPDDRVLEVGAGSGYAAAVLSRIAREVHAVEIQPALAAAAAERLADLGFDNVRVRCGDGALGWPEAAPFDGISVAAGAPVIPRALREQLAPGGRLVAPLGRAPGVQELVRLVRDGDGFRYQSLGPVQFVPLLRPDELSIG